jgi:hypothetical protein
MTRQLAAIVFCASLSAAAIGCAVQGRPFEKVPPPAEHSVIYVYRPYTYGSSLLRPEVVCGEDMMRIGPGGYHAFIVPAGQKVTCSIHTDSTDEVEIRTDARVYYIREDLGSPDSRTSIQLTTTRRRLKFRAACKKSRRRKHRRYVT